MQSNWKMKQKYPLKTVLIIALLFWNDSFVCAFLKSSPHLFSRTETVVSSSICKLSHKVFDPLTSPKPSAIPPSSSGRKIPWIIVGGGIHGLHLAARLLGDQGVNPNDIYIIDDKDLLHTWKTQTNATGMNYLRSSAGFHLDIYENSLRRQFGRQKEYNANGGKRSRKKRRKKSAQIHEGLFSNDYERPRLDIFNDHCDNVIEKYGLDNLHVQGRVTGIEPSNECVRLIVRMTNSDAHDNIEPQTYNAEKVILALGNSPPTYPDWVCDEDIRDGMVSHLLDTDTTKNNDHSTKRNRSTSVAVIGGGISAAHKVLELVENKKKQERFKSHDSKNEHHQIHLICRHKLREQQFDTHQEYMMDNEAVKRSLENGGKGIPSHQRLFSSTTCYKKRRTIILKDRVPGTITPEVHRGKNGLRNVIENGDVMWNHADVISCTRSSILSSEDTTSCRVCLKLELSNGETVTVDKVLLATGFSKVLPGGDLIKCDLVEKAGLKVCEDGCGFPIVNEDLSWHDRIFVTGALAELELGPSARNIAGARLAADRILQTSMK